MRKIGYNVWGLHALDEAKRRTAAGRGGEGEQGMRGFSNSSVSRRHFGIKRHVADTLLFEGQLVVEACESLP